jgi:hypothetical protein
MYQLILESLAAASSLQLIGGFFPHYIVPGVPVNLSAPTINSDSITVSWLQPEITNGLIIHYLVDVTDGSQLIRETMMSMETEFTATSLSPFTNYTFEVAAVTSAGAGMSAVLTVTTDQAGKIRLGTLGYPLLCWCCCQYCCCYY